MGGMFTVLKVRADKKPGDYSDSGWYKHPPGTVAYEFTGNLPPAPRAANVSGVGSMPSTAAGDKKLVEVQVYRPKSGHAGH